MVLALLFAASAFAQGPKLGTSSAIPPPVTGRVGAPSTTQSVFSAQQALGSQGFSVSPDGHLGPATRSALRKFQQKRGLPPSGQLDAATWDALQNPSSELAK